MKYLNQLLSAFFTFLILSCSGDGDGGTPGNTNPSDGDGNTDPVISIVLSSNQSTYLVGEAAFFVVRDQQNSLVTSEASIFVNGDPVNVNPHLFVTNGTYEFVATYQGITSNTLTFEVVTASEYSDTTSFVADGAPSFFTKKVLLEDFTGTWCPQCPPAAAAISSAVSQGDNIFGVGYHYNDPMQISETIFWTSHYNVTGFPTVYVNGPDTRWNYPDMTQVNIELAEEATVGLAVEANLVGGKLDLEVSIGFKSTPNEEVKLMIYLIEGSSTSTSAQSGSSAGINYIHNDILREVYTDQLGDVIPAGNTTAGGIYTRTITGLDLPSDVIDYDDLKVLAFVRNTYTKTFTDFFNNVWENSPHYDIYNLQEAQLGESVLFD